MHDKSGISPPALSSLVLVRRLVHDFIRRHAGKIALAFLCMGVNGLTGDYSRGAAGFWIENGQIAHPVSEMTVAGNLKEMFARMRAANDLEFRVGADSPTLRIDDLTVAGA